MAYIHTAFFICPSVSAKNRPGFLLRKPGRFIMLYSCFLKPSRDYLRGFLIVAWAGAKITERSEQRHIAIFNFSVDSKRFHQFRTTLFIFRSPLYIVNAILFKEASLPVEPFCFHHSSHLSRFLFQCLCFPLYQAHHTFPALKLLRVRKIRLQHLNQLIDFRSGC